MSSIESSSDDIPKRHNSLLRALLRVPVATFVLSVVVALSAVGPLLAPYSPTETIGQPYSPPGVKFLLGTDFLGRDVVSRVLFGGYSLLGVATLATLFGYVIGGTIGLLAGYRRSFMDPVLMRSVDVLMAFPPLLALLVLAAGLGPSAETMIIGIAFIQVPLVARIIYGATVTVSVRGYVEAAIARGENTAYTIFKEVLPNIRGPVGADFGPRLTISILLSASLNFLGLGLQPPIADWGLMISENRPGLTLQPLPAIVPACLIALLTVAFNIVVDSITRGNAQSDDGERE